MNTEYKVGGRSNLNDHQVFIRKKVTFEWIVGVPKNALLKTKMLQS